MRTSPAETLGSPCGKMPQRHSGFHRLSLTPAPPYTGLELRELGGHVPKGVTAHGSPIGPLQFDWLEAALARQVPRFLSSFGCGGLSVRHPVSRCHPEASEVCDPVRVAVKRSESRDLSSCVFSTVNVSSGNLAPERCLSAHESCTLKLQYGGPRSACRCRVDALAWIPHGMHLRDAR
jgi:hypothetical protein